MSLQGHSAYICPAPPQANLVNLVNNTQYIDFTDTGLCLHIHIAIAFTCDCHHPSCSVHHIASSSLPNPLVLHICPALLHLQLLVHQTNEFCRDYEDDVSILVGRSWAYQSLWV